MKTVVGKWGWLSRGKPQEKFFDSADEALDAMRERIGYPDCSMRKLNELGFQLAMLTVTIEADMAMIDIGSVRIDVRDTRPET